MPTMPAPRGRLGVLASHLAVPAASHPSAEAAFELSPRLSGAELAAAIASGQTTSAAALEFYLSRVDRYGKGAELGQCIIVLDKERARAKAKEADDWCSLQTLSSPATPPTTCCCAGCAKARARSDRSTASP